MEWPGIVFQFIKKKKRYSSNENNYHLAKRIGKSIPEKEMSLALVESTDVEENQDGGVGRHTAPPRTTRTDRESNSKGDQHQGNRK